MVSYERFMAVEKELVEMTAEFMRVANKLAQPERQPLTDEQIQKIWDVAAGALPGWSRHIAYARAIEAAHNIGGAKP